MRVHKTMRSCCLIPVVLLCLTLAIISAVWLWSPFPRDAIVPGEATCVAAARVGERAIIYSSQLSREEFDPEEDFGFPHRIRPATTLLRDELVEATPVSAWASGNWCQTRGLHTGVIVSRLDLDDPGLYMKTDSLEALSVRRIGGVQQRLSRELTGLRVDLQDTFAMEHAELWDISLVGKQSNETVLWRRWVNDPGMVRCSIYRIRDGRPQWLFGKIFWGTVWSDPKVILLPSSRERPQAQIIAFQPPIRLLVYRWDGHRFSDTGLSRDAVLRLPGMIIWSYRRFLLIHVVTVVFLIAATIVTIRRQASA